MTCDGSPGNPGTERIPDADGGWDAACLGCSVCRHDPDSMTQQWAGILESVLKGSGAEPKTWSELSAKDRETMDAQAAYYAEMGNALDDDTQYEFYRKYIPNYDEMAELLEYAVAHPEEFQDENGQVLCKSTQRGRGCGHDVNEHTQSSSPNADCCCCTGRHNDPTHVNGCAQCMSVLLGCSELEVPDRLRQNIAAAKAITDGVEQKIMPPVLNRAQRRALAGKGRGRAGGNLPNRRRYR